VRQKAFETTKARAHAVCRIEETSLDIYKAPAIHLLSSKNLDSVAAHPFPNHGVQSLSPLAPYPGQTLFMALDLGFL
jgi:hypothetical protein